MRKTQAIYFNSKKHKNVKYIFDKLQLSLTLIEKKKAENMDAEQSLYENSQILLPDSPKSHRQFLTNDDMDLLCKPEKKNEHETSFNRRKILLKKLKEEDEIFSSCPERYEILLL